MKRRVLFFLIPLIIVFLMLSCTKKPLPPDSGDPVIQTITASPTIVSKGGTVYLWVSVTDPEEHRIYYQWSCSDGQFFGDESLTSQSSTVNPCWWEAPDTEGNFTISVTCTDSIGEDFGIVDTLITVSVSIYSLDSIIGEDLFSSPFAMYIDDDGNLFVTDPGLSAVHFHDGSRWFSWNYMGLDTTVTTTPTYDTMFDTSGAVLWIDTTEIVTTIVARDLFDSPTAVTVDEPRNYLLVANVELESTIVAVHDIDTMFTPADSVWALSTLVTMSTDSGNGVWDTLVDTLTFEKVCLYGFQFNENDRRDLNFRISAPYSFAIDPLTDWLYISTRISIISYDSTWIVDGWGKNWSTATATQGINYEGKGMKLHNDALYIACFGTSQNVAYSVVRRFLDISNPNGPTADDANFWIADSFVNYCSGIAVSEADDHVFITAGGGSLASFHRVVEYDENGNFVRAFGSLGDKEDQFNNPTDIFIDLSGRIFVVEMGNYSIKVFCH
jgi:DNA-binding beta-propeller fold protein YncE